jgi:predicted 2-oxoglutarate/Fe(II)-dependent dioxygenase YbiX
LHTGPPYYVWENAIPPAVCDAIVAEWNDQYVTGGSVQVADGSYEVDTEIRRADSMSFGETHWVHSIPLHYAALANNRIWHYDVSSVDATILLRYEDEGHYRWHHDIAFGQPTEDNPRPEHRKLSIVASLTDPSEFEGGRLRFQDLGGSELDDDRVQSQGSVTVFPSHVKHMVEPLESGVRYSLVSWLLGLPFR